MNFDMQSKEKKRVFQSFILKKSIIINVENIKSAIFTNNILLNQNYEGKCM